MHGGPAPSTPWWGEAPERPFDFRKAAILPKFNVCDAAQLAEPGPALVSAMELGWWYAQDPRLGSLDALSNQGSNTSPALEKA